MIFEIQNCPFLHFCFNPKFHTLPGLIFSEFLCLYLLQLQENSLIRLKWPLTYIQPPLKAINADILLKLFFHLVWIFAIELIVYWFKVYTSHQDQDYNIQLYILFWNDLYYPGDSFRSLFVDIICFVLSHPSVPGLELKYISCTINPPKIM